MADIILINDKNEDQVLSGVKKMVARGATGDDVGFSIGAAESSIITNIYGMKTDQKIPAFDADQAFSLTGTPMTIKIYVDVPREMNIISYTPLGKMFIYSKAGTSKTGTVLDIGSIADYSATEIDNGTIRYGRDFTFSYTDQTNGQLAGNAFMVVSFLYDGVKVTKENGETILSGQNAGKFMSSDYFLGYITGLSAFYQFTEQYTVYDMREDAIENMTINRLQGLTIPRRIYMPRGITSLPNFSFCDMPNLELVDFSSSGTIPTLNGYAFNGLKSDYVIKVPASLYNEWVVNSQWKKYSSHIVSA